MITFLIDQVEKKKRKNEQGKSIYSYVDDEYQNYIAMKWDYEHGQLNPMRLKRFKELEEKYDKR